MVVGSGRGRGRGPQYDTPEPYTLQASILTPDQDLYSRRGVVRAPRLLHLHGHAGAFAFCVSAALPLSMTSVLSCYLSVRVLIVSVMTCRFQWCVACCEQFVVCWVLLIVCCLLRVVCCLLLLAFCLVCVCRWLLVTRLPVAWLLFFVAGWVLLVVCAVSVFSLVVCYLFVCCCGCDCCCCRCGADGGHRPLLAGFRALRYHHHEQQSHHEQSPSS